jgi:SAM-dependent methyltransferase
MMQLVAAEWVPTVCPICNKASAVELLGTRAENLIGRRCTLEMRIDDTLCLTCGFIYAAARPSEAALNAYYRDAHIRCSEYIDVAPDYDRDRRLATIRRLVPPAGRILELGAGTGDFCSSLNAAGFNANPVDPLASAVWPSGSFDAVLAYLLLEHVHDPRSVIADVAQRLRPGGVLIIEVPDFLRDPVASLVAEHLWHFAPEHLSALFADRGVVVVEIDRITASREFAFMIAGRRAGEPRRPVFNPELVAAMRASYRRAAKLTNAEELRTQALCQDVTASTPPCIFVWAANEYATRIGRHLADIGYSEIQLIDSGASKIGTLHEGFTHPIKPPVFSGGEPEGSVILLCSPAWNDQIRAQIEVSRLRRPRIIDAVKWQPSVRNEKQVVF